MKRVKESEVVPSGTLAKQVEYLLKKNNKYEK